ncbi:hypothetical protein [Nitrincola sp.]|uniref:hypothetical protein n=1 Tax=Nitrincola sp. TaxID=1926584 RepID=UPI003A8DAD61
MNIKYIMLLVVALAFNSAFAIDEVSSEYQDEIFLIYDLYKDSQASLVEESINLKIIRNDNGSNKITLASFVVEGFHGGNNLNQFFVMFESNENQENNKTMVTGVFPVGIFKVAYDIENSEYSSGKIRIPAPQNPQASWHTANDLEFQKVGSLWWDRVDIISSEN